MKFFKELRLKILDPVILVLLIAASFLPFLFFMDRGAEATEVLIKLEGKTIKRLDLSVNQTWTFESSSGEINEIEILDRKVRVHEANCPDQIDVQAGWKSKNGDTLVCLPHSLVVELTGDGPVKQDGKVVDYQ